MIAGGCHYSGWDGFFEEKSCQNYCSGGMQFHMPIISFCSNTGSVGDDSYWTSRKNSLELIELSSINKISLV